MSNLLPSDDKLVESVFGKEAFASNTKTVRINLAALTQMEWSREIEVPANATQAQLDELAQEYYTYIAGDEFWEDPDYWEKSLATAEEVE